MDDNFSGSCKNDDNNDGGYFDGGDSSMNSNSRNSLHDISAAIYHDNNLHNALGDDDESCKLPVVTVSAVIISAQKNIAVPTTTLTGIAVPDQSTDVHHSPMTIVKLSTNDGTADASSIPAAIIVENGVCTLLSEKCLHWYQYAIQTKAMIVIILFVVCTLAILIIIVLSSNTSARIPRQHTTRTSSNLTTNMNNNISMLRDLNNVVNLSEYYNDSNKSGLQTSVDDCDNKNKIESNDNDINNSDINALNTH